MLGRAPGPLVLTRLSAANDAPPSMERAVNTSYAAPTAFRSSLHPTTTVVPSQQRVRDPGEAFAVGPAAVSFRSLGSQVLPPSTERLKCGSRVPLRSSNHATYTDRPSQHTTALVASLAPAALRLTFTSVERQVAPRSNDVWKYTSAFTAAPRVSVHAAKTAGSEQQMTGPSPSGVAASVSSWTSEADRAGGNVT